MAASIGSRARGTERVGQVAIAALIAVLGWAYISGYLFLWMTGGRAYSASPLTWVRYQHYYGDNPGVRRRLAISGWAGGVLVLGGCALGLWPRRPSLHGDARFATRAEVSRAGLLGNDGLILGKLGHRYLMLPGQQGVLVAAPPRTGKGVGIVIPNLLHFPGSVVCVDIKKENWTVTAGYRASCGQPVFLLDFFAENGRTARWNPLDAVQENPLRQVDGLQRIASILWPEVPGADPFWSAAAQTMFLGIALYVFETPGLPRTIGEILRQGMVTGEEGFGAHWRRVIEERRESEHPLSEACIKAISDLVDLAGTTASGIRKTFTSRLDLWLNPILDAATSSSDFNLRDLRRNPISIYVGVNPADIGRLRRVLNLFFEQAIGEQTRELPEHNPELRYQVLMMLDEFTALGRLPVMGNSLGYLPGYNVRVVIVIQVLSQLAEVYGVNAAATFLKTLAVRILFAPKEYEDAEAISKELGTRTIKVKSRSHPAFGSGKGPSTSESERARPLMLPQEVKALGEDREIVFYENLAPIRARKIRYFQDPILRRRVRPPPDVPCIADPGSRDAAPSRPRPPDDAGRSVERLPRREQPRKPPIRPRRRPTSGSLEARHPPTDAATVDAAVAQYLDELTRNDAGPVEPGPAG
ncbi:MAG: type IV secretory system conjugative DNA transfer family protein [Cyanobacteria bacterium SZAS LIN-2]|nr:type IV secretory system conjugative DNA transfer family protein [Cyanobacteria bacterium SZAS LIN-2]